jgi:hypothetical protein
MDDEFEFSAEGQPNSDIIVLECAADDIGQISETDRQAAREHLEMLRALHPEVFEQLLLLALKRIKRR